MVLTLLWRVPVLLYCHGVHTLHTQNLSCIESHDPNSATPYSTERQWVTVPDHKLVNGAAIIEHSQGPT